MTIQVFIVKLRNLSTTLYTVAREGSEQRGVGEDDMQRVV